MMTASRRSLAVVRWLAPRPLVTTRAAGTARRSRRYGATSAPKDYQSGAAMTAQLLTALQRAAPEAGLCTERAASLVEALIRDVGVKPGKVVRLLTAEPGLATCSAADIAPAVRSFRQPRGP